MPKSPQDVGIVLTKRGKHQGMDIPMCGVPVGAPRIICIA
jgi:DNA mismatch repair protein MutS